MVLIIQNNNIANYVINIVNIVNKILDKFVRYAKIVVSVVVWDERWA